MKVVTGLATFAVLATKLVSPSTMLPRKMKIFDFNSPDFKDESVGEWWESSDTVRRPGKSKAVLSLQKSALFQRAVMFALLNPQPNGAAFAGVKHSAGHLDLSTIDSRNATGFEIEVRGQGQLPRWKVVLTTNSPTPAGLSIPIQSYEAYFAIDLSSQDFERKTLPFNEFRAYYRGQLVEGAPPLEPSTINTVGLQTFGGVYHEEKQSGVGSLEINYIAIVTQE